MRYAVNWGFRVKMVLVVIAGLNALWFWVRLNKPMHSWEPHGGHTGRSQGGRLDFTRRMDRCAAVRPPDSLRWDGLNGGLLPLFRPEHSHDRVIFVEDDVFQCAAEVYQY